jgi:hypothetical protein
MIQVPKDLDFQKIEDLLKEVWSNSSNNRNLRVSANRLNFTGGGLGVEVALTQLLITWARVNEKTDIELHTYIREEEFQKILYKYCSTLYGICALYMAPKITDQKHKKIERYVALEPAKELISAMDTSEYRTIMLREKTKEERLLYQGTKQKGGTPNIFLLSIAGAEKQYIRSLYTSRTNTEGYRVVRDSPEMKSEFEKIIDSMDNTLVENPIKSTIKKSKLSEQVGIILNELIKNAEEHAKTDHKGNKYLREISGLKVGYSRYKQGDLEKITRGFWEDSYIDFISNRYFRNRDHIQIVEISVFDSGPGFSRRWMKKDFGEFSFNQEIQAIQECFKKGESSKSNEGRGEGLYNVSKIVQILGGSIRVRTGRTLTSRGYYPEDKRVSTEIDNYPTQLAPIEGTALTICIPIES